MSTDTDAGLTEALDRLNARLDRLESKVDALGAGAAGPPAQRPEVAAALDRLVGRMDKIEAMVDAFGTLATRIPDVADAAGTSARWAWGQAEAAGIDPLQSGQQAAELALLLADPEAMALLKRLLERRDALEAAADALDAIDPDDLKTVATQGAVLTKQLAALVRAPELARLLDAGADPKALATAEYATTALVETRGQTIEPVGPFGALFKLSDPDVKRAIGFSLALAKRFGQLLDR